MILVAGKPKSVVLTSVEGPVVRTWQRFHMVRTCHMVRQSPSFSFLL